MSVHQNNRMSSRDDADPRSVVAKAGVARCCGSPLALFKALCGAFWLQWLMVPVGAQTCAPPKASMSAEFLTQGGREGTVRLTIAPEDLSLANLVCLSKTLNVSRPEWQNVAVLVFDSATAARGYKMYQNEYPGAVRAVYALNRLKAQESLSVALFADSDLSQYDTKIDLASGAIPRCRFEVSARCLLVLRQSPTVPAFSRTMKMGTVTVAGRIERSGVVTDIRTAQAPEARPANDALVSQAASNLASWKFEPSNTESYLSVTYTYQLDTNIIRPVLEFDSPTRVTVRANPRITKKELARLLLKGVN